MMKKMTALLLALVLCAGIATTAFAAKGPYTTTIFDDQSEITFAMWAGSSFSRAAATWIAMTEMKRADVSIEDIDLSKPSYVGLYEGSGSLDIYLPISKGYLDCCFSKNGTFTIYEYPVSTPAKIEERHPSYKVNDLDDLLNAGSIVYEILL